MDLYRKVRLACAEGMSQREAARHFNISRDSGAKMMAFSVPPGYRRSAPVKRPKLDAFTGGYTIVKDYMRQRERLGREMFVLLAHPLGHAQADFGEAVVVIGGIEQKTHFFVSRSP